MTCFHPSSSGIHAGGGAVGAGDFRQEIAVPPRARVIHILRVIVIMLACHFWHRKAAVESHAAPVIRALFLDAAGTLIEPAEPVAEVYARTAAAFGLRVEPAVVKRWFGEVFGGLSDPDYTSSLEGDIAEREWWRLLVRDVFAGALSRPMPESVFEPCFDALFNHYADPAAWRVFPEVPEVLAAARAAGLKLAVVSNFDRRLHGILAGHGLRFDAVITSADACSRKPHAAIFHFALDQLGLQPAQVFHAGDSPVADLEGSAAAGIKACLISRPATDLRVFLAEALASERQGQTRGS